jgi:hypothetical protein
MASHSMVAASEDRMNIKIMPICGVSHPACWLSSGSSTYEQESKKDCVRMMQDHKKEGRERQSPFCTMAGPMPLLRLRHTLPQKVMRFSPKAPWGRSKVGMHVNPRDF